MKQALIDRMERRIKYALMEITSEIEEIHEFAEKLADLCGGSEEAKRLQMSIIDANLSIEGEVTEILGTLGWFKGRIASEGKKNG